MTSEGPAMIGAEVYYVSRHGSGIGFAQGISPGLPGLGHAADPDGIAIRCQLAAQNHLPSHSFRGILDIQ